MTLLQPIYEKQAYDKGYQEGHLAARVEQLRLETDKVRAGILESMNKEYEQRIRKAYMQGKRAAIREGYDKGYLDGKADGFDAGATAVRGERLAASMMPGENAFDAVARVQAMEEAILDFSTYLQQILAQVKEGSPIAVAVAERIECAIEQYSTL